MSEEKRYSLDEAHLFFAKKVNGEVWSLLEKPNRTAAENELMLHAAHASLYHWLRAGTGVNHQRGEWLIARVHAVLGHADLALQHATRCLELTSQHSALMEDFDFAFAQECMVRAHAVAGNRAEALKHLQHAKEAGEKIKDAEDKKIFFDDLRSGDWHGVQ